ncbi:MAG: hypothetical protein J6D29_07900 [Solobacterium sp.]|nr:hypothetical protein [Solobacterium sp.]
MGTFINSVLVKQADEEIIKALNHYSEDIFGLDSHWAGFNVNDDPFEIAKELSNRYHMPTIGIMCHDSDVSMLRLFDHDTEVVVVTPVDEELLEEYSINERNTNIEFLKDYLVEPYTIEDLYNVLNQEDIIFAEDVLFEILKMLGVEEELFDEMDML